MRIQPIQQGFADRNAPRTPSFTRTAATSNDTATVPRLPSAIGYMLAAGIIATTVFFGMWWWLEGNGDESPWVPAGLASAVVMLIAAATREVFVRRAWTQHLLEQNRRAPSTAQTKKHISSGGGRNSTRIERYTTALRALQHQSSQLNAAAADATPEAHLELYHSCKQFLASAGDALSASNARPASNEARVVLRSGQERARTLAKQHLLEWARKASRSLTHEAQRRALLADKIETAQHALDVIDSALKVYPDEAELHSSAQAIRELISTVKVAHWVELAERAAFKGQFAKAIDRYQDALFYLARGTIKEDARSEAAERIEREMSLLRARLNTAGTPYSTHRDARKSAGNRFEKN